MTENRVNSSKENIVASTQEKDYIRLSINVDPIFFKEVENFVTQKRLSKSELFRRAVKVYELLVKEQESGKNIYLEKKGDKQRELLKLIF